METLTSQKERPMCKLTLISFSTFPCTSCNMQSGNPALVGSSTEIENLHSEFCSLQALLLFQPSVAECLSAVQDVLNSKNSEFWASIFLNNVLLTESQLLYTAKTMHCGSKNVKLFTSWFDTFLDKRRTHCLLLKNEWFVLSVKKKLYQRRNEN